MNDVQKGDKLICIKEDKRYLKTLGVYTVEDMEENFVWVKIEEDEIGSRRFPREHFIKITET